LQELVLCNSETPTLHMPTLHRWCHTLALHGVLLAAIALASPAFAADEPDLIFKRSTVFKWLTPNDKLATYGLDDPEVEGVSKISPGPSLERLGDGPPAFLAFTGRALRGMNPLGGGGATPGGRSTTIGSVPS
jgi:hypothetical protein